MPLTDAQRNVLPSLRAMFNSFEPPFGKAESVEERARQPEPGILPDDITVRIEIAPPSPHPDPTLESTGALKAPERVPIYFYTHRNDSGPDVDSKDIGDTRVIFWIHGGGNVAGHPTVEPFLQYYVQLLRTIASDAGGAAKCVLILPSYRLATVPENAFPAGLQDIVAAYDYILGKGYKASNIIIAGDSAGGNHAAVLTHLILQSDRPSPHGVFAIAPGSMVDQDLLSDYARSLAKYDMLDLALTERMTTAYLGDSGIARSHPLISAAFLTFTTSWPKTLIIVGSADVGIDASRELQKRLAAQGRQVELVEYDERPHSWWVLPQIFPEDIQDSVERIARFLPN